MKRKQIISELSEDIKSVGLKVGELDGSEVIIKEVGHPDMISIHCDATYVPEINRIVYKKGLVGVSLTDSELVKSWCDSVYQIQE